MTKKGPTVAFNLSSIKRTKRVRAPRIVVCGPGKVGKTTFAASAPDVVFIRTEDGCDAVDVPAFPLCASLAGVYEAIGALLNEEHAFKTIALDSLDWLEPMLHAHVCAANKWRDIEAPGFGKGYVAATAEWRTLLDGLDALRDQRGMGIILIAHDKVKRVENPLNDGYDSHTMKLNDRATAIVSEWADVIGFASHKIYTSEKEAGGFGKRETKAVGGGERVLMVESHPAHCGGNRFGLGDMPLSWGAFSAAFSSI